MVIHSFVRQILVGFCLAAACCASVAAETWHTSTIKYLYPHADGTFVLTFDVNAPTCTSSTVSRYHYVRPSPNGMTDDGAKKIYAAALMAMATDKAVQFVFDDATSNCYINRLMVAR